MTPAIRQAIRSALDMPLLSERKCDAVYRAVIGAMREPTDAMLMASGDAYFHLRQEDSNAQPGCRIWRAMIDSLLAETVE